MDVELAKIPTSPNKSPRIRTAIIPSPRTFSQDEIVLARFGKRQQLKRRFGLLSVIGLTSTLMITWEGITATLLNGLQNGGPAGLIYGYLFVWAGSIMQALVMAEMASMIPLAGGPFNWVLMELITFGFDLTFETAEEILNAQKIIPLSMGLANVLNGTLGFAMLIALLFCMPSDISSVLDADTYYPFMSIYTYAVGSNAGGTALACIVVVTQIFASVGILATASRMLWAFAREEGLPFSRYIAKVDQNTLLPLYAIGTTTVINLLLALINIGSTVGFGAFISLIVVSYVSSFMLAAAVMLNKRLTTPAAAIPWGPFKLGRAGVPVTVLALAYSLLVGFFSMWPTEVNPSLEAMNYCVLVFGGALIFAGLFWLFYGRKVYTGPVLEIGSVQDR
ncbi:hypothetical protein MMC12_003218 [Toensbergia leucococca]|nr:hypothetical protein [Toensbergia leucococca]